MRVHGPPAVYARNGASAARSSTKAVSQTPPMGLIAPNSNAVADPDLATVSDAWADLPAAVRAGIVAMVRAATESTP